MYYVGICAVLYVEIESIHNITQRFGDTRSYTSITQNSFVYRDDLLPQFLLLRLLRLHKLPTHRYQCLHAPDNLMIFPLIFSENSCSPPPTIPVTWVPLAVYRPCNCSGVAKTVQGHHRPIGVGGGGKGAHV